MYAFLREFLSGRPSPAPGHTCSHHHPSLEVLEDRAVPAVTAVGPTPLDPTLAAPAQQAAVQQAPAQQAPAQQAPAQNNTTPFTQAAFTAPFANNALLANTLASQNPLGLPQGGTPNGGQQTFSQLGQLSNQTIAAFLRLQFDQSAAGFQGRVVFPGTGMMVRAATEPGPMAQTPGLFLVGGSGGMVSGEGRTTSDASSPTGQQASGGAALDSGDNRQDTRTGGSEEEDDTTSSTTTTTEDPDSADGTSGEAQPDRPVEPPNDGE